MSGLLVSALVAVRLPLDENPQCFCMLFAATGLVPSLFTKHARKFGRIGLLFRNWR